MDETELHRIPESIRAEVLTTRDALLNLEQDHEHPPTRPASEPDGHCGHSQASECEAKGDAAVLYNPESPNGGRGGVVKCSGAAHRAYPGVTRRGDRVDPMV
jgi:hypothetical protein